MANRFRQMMKQDRDDSDISAAPGRRELISHEYMKKRSNSSTLKKRLLSALSFYFSGCRAGSSLSVKGPDDLPRLCNSDLSRSYHHQPDETASSSSTNLPYKSKNPNLNNLVEDVNKEADNFIAKMREGLKIERKVAEMEYMDRIQRGE